jgi:hypothetical protein
MRISILVALVVLVAAGARAQNREPRLFVDGALLGDRDPKYPFESSMAVGGSGAIGFRISNHFSVRFEAEVPVMHTGTVNTNYGGRVMSETESFRTTTYAALFAGHYQAHKKVDLAFLGGLSAAIPETRYSGYFETLSASGAVVRHDYPDSRGSYRTGVLTTGVDVAISLTPHFAIVPELRFHTELEYLTLARPKVAIRWRF